MSMMLRAAAGSGGSSAPDPHWASVVALLKGDGENNSTTIVDSSPLGSNWTPRANNKIVTAQKRFGTGSILFTSTGTDSYLVPTASASNFAFGTGDFTVEMWIRTDNAAAGQVLFDARPSGTSGAYLTMSISGGKLVHYANSADQIVGATSLSTGVWYHVALSRVSGTSRLFVNGSLDGSVTDSISYLCPSGRPFIGSSSWSPNSAFFRGYADEIRITTVGRYATTFAPPWNGFPTS